MVWDYSGSHPRYRAADIVYKHTKNSVTRAAVNRILHLVDTLLTMRFSSPTEIRKFFVRGTVPLFSPAMAEKVYSRLYAKKGGAEGIVGDSVETFGNTLVSWIFGENPQNSSIHNTLFILKDIEQNGVSFLPFLTPALIRSGIEIFVEFLLTLAASAEEAVEVILTVFTVGTMPVAVGEVIGEVIKAIISLLAAIVATSRGDFETAFDAILLGIPIAGVMLNKAYKSEEKLSGKYKSKIINTMNSIPGLQELAMPSAAVGGTRRKRVKHRRTTKHKWTRRQ